MPRDGADRPEAIMLTFLGIGAQKCGSTWLYEQLSRHAKVSFPAGKEVHFWDKARQRGVDYYRGLFTKGEGEHEGDVTPAYAILPPEVIEECHCAFPRLRLIYVIRNPLERAWSHAKMDACAAGLTPGSLPDAWFLDHFHSRKSLARGDYELCLRNWLDCYDEDKFLLLFFEELAHSPSSLLAKCCRHLGLDDIYENHVPGQKTFAGPPDAIRRSLVGPLRLIYKRKIESLACYLKADLSAWLR